MPFTPFHMGPGLLFKSALNRYFSLMIFGLSQVLIDLEPAFYMLTDNPPLHRFFHTYLGAIVVVVVTIAIGKPICEWLLRFWNSRLNESQARWLVVPVSISQTALISGAMIGAISHMFFDSFMHADITPFSPFSDVNSLAYMVSVTNIYLACVVAGIAGLLVFGVYRLVRGVGVK